MPLQKKPRRRLSSPFFWATGISAWRAKAIEMFLELKRDIEDSECAGDLRFSLLSVFRHGIKTEDYDISLLVSKYADWCRL